MTPPAARRLVLAAGLAVTAMTVLVAWSAGGVAPSVMVLAAVGALASAAWVVAAARRRPAGS